MVEATGLEPAASCSQSKHSTKLSYASIYSHLLYGSLNLRTTEQNIVASLAWSASRFSLFSSSSASLLPPQAALGFVTCSQSKHSTKLSYAPIYSVDKHTQRCILYQTVVRLSTEILFKQSLYFTLSRYLFIVVSSLM